ncbi:MAG: hypothetical protein Q7S95_01335 [bacterium]|nr:hypothetical protein [bacterium]
MQGGIDLKPIADRIRSLTPLLRDTLAAAAHGLDKNAATAKLGCRKDAYDQRFHLLYRHIGVEHLGRGEKRRAAVDAYRLYEAGVETAAPAQDANGASAPHEDQPAHGFACSDVVAAPPAAPEPPHEAMLPDVPCGISGGYGVASVVSLGKCENILDVRPLVLGPAFAAELARGRKEDYELHGSFVHYQSLSDTAVSLTQMFLVKRRP